MPDEIRRYSVTADVYSFKLDDKQTDRLELLVRTFLSALFPLGVVKNYPNIQLIEDRTPLST